MIAQRIKGLFSLFVILQLSLAVMVYWLHFFVINHVYSEAAEVHNYIVYCLLLIFGLVLEAANRSGVQNLWFTENLFKRARTAFTQTAFAYGPIIFFLVAAKDTVISRFFLFSFIPVLYSTLLFSSFRVPQWLGGWIFRDLRQERTLLVGTIRQARKLQDWLQQKEDVGVRVMGMLTNDLESSHSSVPVLGAILDLERTVREHHITQVILLELPNQTDTLTHVSETCEQLGIRLLVKSDLDEKFRHPVVYMENDGLHFFALRTEPLENPVNRLLKRLTDIIVSAIVVVVLLPVICLMVWIFQRLQSPGPLFYVQKRSGIQNIRFKIIKFRTMHPDNPDVARQATVNDARVYPAGVWFRKMSIDELPQFINVLKGEMSVVGPRPHLEEHNERFARVMENYYVRAFVKPGITGLAQVRGFRGEATDEELLRKRIESDIYYLENWALSTDLIIMCKTAVQMFLPPKTAH